MPLQIHSLAKTLRENGKFLFIHSLADYLADVILSKYCVVTITEPETLDVKSVVGLCVAHLRKSENLPIHAGVALEAVDIFKQHYRVLLKADAKLFIYKVKLDGSQMLCSDPQHDYAAVTRHFLWTE
jgi:hypothetical protein